MRNVLKRMKNRKMDFSIELANCTCFIKTGAKLRGWGLHILSGEIPGVGGGAPYQEIIPQNADQTVCRHFVCLTCPTA